MAEIMQYARLWEQDGNVQARGFTDAEWEGADFEDLLGAVNIAAASGWCVHTYDTKENHYLLERVDQSRVVVTSAYNFPLREGDEIHWIYGGQSKSALWVKDAHPQTAGDPKWGYPLVRIVRDGVTVWAAPE